MADYIAGERYPMTAQDAASVMRQGWPAVIGEPDLARGRRFLKAPGDWEFWLKDGRRVDFSVGFGGIIVGVSKQPDPSRPEPLASVPSGV